MPYSIREGFAVINDETLEVEDYHDTREEANYHLTLLHTAEAEPTGAVAAEVAEMRKRKKKVAPARPKGGQYTEPVFVPEGQANLHNPTFVAVDPGTPPGVAYVRLTGDMVD
jgi:hypothetical protein